MKIGLPFIDQIRSGHPAKAGNWVAQTFTQTVGAISAGYHTEHTADDTHGAIHCTSISERSRTTPMGEWQSLATPAVVGSGAMTVTIGTVRTYAWTLIGKTILVAFDFQSITIGGTPDLFIKVPIPAGFHANRFTFN